MFLRLLLFVIGASGAWAADRHRVLVSSDIGGTDPDDFQSMVHFLLYADVFDVEGIVSSPYGPGRLAHIRQVIDLYEKDYPSLRKHSRRYPKPAQLRAISKQGAFDSPGFAGVGTPTDGSRWIIECARRADKRPLNVLVWGGIEDLAQALHDAPDILQKLRVYFIGGPNKMWSADAFAYIEHNHPNLWMIESNSTYRGWFTGGDQSGDWGNQTFVAKSIAGRGALGTFFASLLKSTMKMGDSPAVTNLLNDRWGGHYVRVWDDRETRFNRLTTEADTVEAFGIVEFALAGVGPGAKVRFDNRVEVPTQVDANGVLHFRFSPRDAKVWTYTVESASMKQSGKFTAAMPPVEKTQRKSTKHPHWWTDDPDPALAEGVHAGAKSVNRWRREFLADFAARMRRITTQQ